MIPKLTGACYAVWLMDHICNINSLKSIYYAYFHSLIKYGIIILGDFQQWEDLFTKENCQNYGWCTTRNLM